MSTNNALTESEYGVRSDGTFRKKPIDVIRADMKHAFEQELGGDIELKPSSPMTQIIDAVAVEVATQWDAAEAAYYASFYEDSFGEQLDKQLALAGFQRRSLRGATGEVVFSREDSAPRDITVPEGTQVTTRRTETRPPIPFETTDEEILDEGETSVTVPIVSLSPWQTDLDEEWLGEETNVDVGTIVRIPEPVSGIDAVTNELATGDEDEGFVRGRDRESDARFKLRYETRRASQGVSTVSAMEGSILNHAEDIIDVRVDEVRDIDEGYGPEVTVLAPGVDDDTIAQAILNSRAAGLESFGDEEGIGIDDGVEYTERYNRADEIDIYLDIEVTVRDTFSAADGADDIRDRIIRFIGGEDSLGDMYPGLTIGEDVFFDQVFRRVMDQRGVLYGNMEMGTDSATLSTDDITIGDVESAMTNFDIIDIEVEDAD